MKLVRGCAYFSLRIEIKKEKGMSRLGSCQEDNQIIKVFMHILERHDFDILSASCRLMLLEAAQSYTSE